MKKLILGFGIFLFSVSSFAVEGYDMKSEPCSNGNTYDVCRYTPDLDCSIMEQTFCDDPVIGG